MSEKTHSSVFKLNNRQRHNKKQTQVDVLHIWTSPIHKIRGN